MQALSGARGMHRTKVFRRGSLYVCHYNCAIFLTRGYTSTKEPISSRPPRRRGFTKLLEEEVYKDEELMREEEEEFASASAADRIIDETEATDASNRAHDAKRSSANTKRRERPSIKNASRSYDRHRPSAPKWRQKPFYGFQTMDEPYMKSGEIDMRELSYNAVELADQQMPPHLAHNLDRVLFNSGVHFLKDPRSGVYNFSPYLENIMSIKDFDFTKVPAYIPSGKDSKLAEIAKKNGKKYVGSTSSLTGILSHLHRLLSHERRPHIMSVSKFFPGKTRSFTFTQLKPVSVFLRYNSITGTHSIDSDQSKNEEIIVSVLGHLLESLLTTPEVEFEQFRKGAEAFEEVPETPSNAYHYTESGSILMRSQLDCVDTRLPGSGVFDLKTRAVCAVRHDMDYAQINDGSNYIVHKLDGEYESFAREWYELIRSTMFKYSLQARIGRMDGIFLAYHNIKQMFGFQYVPLEELDKIYHTSHLLTNRSHQKDGNSELDIEDAISEDLDTKMSQCASLIAEAEFKLSIELMTQIFDKIVASTPNSEQSFNVVFHRSKKGLVVFTKPMTEENIAKIQNSTDEPERVPKGPEMKKDYVKGQDPNTIWSHAEANSDWLPPDVNVYEIDIRTLVNNKLIQPTDHPTLESEDDIWKVQYKMFDLPSVLAIRAFSQVFGELEETNPRITSIPQLVRLEEEIEEKIRLEAMEKLKPPTRMQQLMRTLSDRGRQQQLKEDETDVTKGKTIWFPKTLEHVDK